jgi:hypothetical protein
MATEGTKFQVNYKLPDGTLINLYAATVTELEAGLADLAMNALNIKATGVELGASTAAPAPTVAAVAAQFNATPISQGDTRVNPPASDGSQSCRHGEMAFRSGTSAKGPWKGYMCAAPKGATDKCDTIWVR